MNDRRATGASDEELARRYRRDPAGDAGRSAASELFERYWERVYLWCFRRIGQHETARDVAQEVLISAYQALGTFEGRCRYSSWVFTIMRNRCFRALRRPGLVRDEDYEIDMVASADKPADSILIEQEDEEEILDLIKQTLDPEEQAALWLRSFERLPVEGITRLLNIRGASGARGVLQNARRKIRMVLEKRAARREENL